MTPLQPQEIRLCVWNHTQFSDSQHQRLRGLLSQSELARNSRFSQPFLRRRDAICRGLLRHQLSQLLDLPSDAIALKANPNGKPLLAKPRRKFHFNYSHSGDYVAYAFSRHAAVGVDIENSQRRNNTTGIANHFFAAAEVAALESLPKSKQKKRFFEYWTLKEAYIKARGEGIFIGLGKFSFDLDSSVISSGKTSDIGIAFCSDQFDTPRNWQFQCMQPLENYQLAVAMNSERPMSTTLELREPF